MTTQVAKSQEEKKQNGRQGVEQTEGGETNATQRSSSMTPNAGFNPFHRLRDEFNRLFDHFLPGWPSLGELQRSDGCGLDVQDDDQAITVRAEVPGFEAKDFDIQVRGNQLTMCANQNYETEDRTADYRQWRRQEFYRSIALPSGVDPKNVTAEYRNGILTVRIPRTEKCESQRIQVKG